MKFFKQLALLVSVLLRRSGATIEDHVKPALRVVDALKAAINNPALDIITELTKTELDEVVLKKAREVLNDFANALHASKGLPAEGFRPSRANDLVLHLFEQPGPVQSAVYSKIASSVARKLSGGKLREF